MDKDTNPKTFVWALPTRLFHWSFGTCITLAFLSGEGIIPLNMEQHMWLGSAALTLILFRIFWGLFAGDYARFDRFSLRLSALSVYAAQLIKRTPPSHAGHSPAGSWSVVLILAITLTQSITGLMSSDAIFTEGPLVPMVPNEIVDTATNIHHWVSKMVLAIVVLHLLAVFYYEAICKQQILLAMITGSKKLQGQTARERPAAAILLALAAGGLVWLIYLMPEIW